MKTSAPCWKSFVLSFTLLGLLLPWLVGCQSANSHAGQKTFRVMTYNIHHGEGLDGKVDLERIAALIKREQADIVALQEVDRGVQRTGRRDVPSELAALTGMTCLFSKNIAFQGGEYGNAVLTRFPVRQWTNTHLPMLQAGEQRGILQLSLQVQGRELVFLDTHLDHHSEAERLASAVEIQRLILQYGRRPMVLCGDMNTVPGTQTYQQLARNFTDAWTLSGLGNGNTIPAEKPVRRIDYIWLHKAAPLSPLKVWVPQSEASDHLPVVAEFRFP